MRELLRQLAVYNIWANDRINKVILALPEEKQVADAKQFHQYTTNHFAHVGCAKHLVAANENAWTLYGPVIISKALRAMRLMDGWASRSWYEMWIQQCTRSRIDHVFQYYTTKKELIKVPIYQMLMHVFNHDTYHRGQLINMLRQIGIDKLPQTDFFIWTRLKK